ncbi:MAG: hypothetical protein WCD76_13415, partial [Pyrinomonadaceae bacterium]
MKNASRFLTTIALATTFTIPALAQTAASSTTTAATTAQNDDAKAALYAKHVENRKKKDTKGNPDPVAQKVAYETGKEYLSKFGGDTNEGNAAIVAYIQKFVTGYEKAVLEFESNKAFDSAVASKNYPKAYELGRPLVVAQPDNFGILLTLVQIGRDNASAGPKADKSLFADSARYTRSAIQMVESGKVSDLSSYKTTREELLGYLNFTLGMNLRESSPDEAIAAFLKAAQSNSSFKTFGATYSNLGTLYFENEYKKLAADYNTNYNGKDKTPESEAAFARLNQVLDRVIDSFARAVALSTQNDPATQAFKTNVKNNLTAVYKSRHNDSEAGLNELIAGVLAKPLPIPGQEPVPT